MLIPEAAGYADSSFIRMLCKDTSPNKLTFFASPDPPGNPGDNQGKIRTGESSLS